MVKTSCFHEKSCSYVEVVCSNITLTKAVRLFSLKKKIQNQTKTLAPLILYFIGYVLSVESYL